MTDIPVFGRYGGSRCIPAISEWLGSNDLTARAMARNLMHDHNVSEARQRAFEQFLPEPCNLGRAISDYFHQRVMVPHPDFLDPALNGQNWVTPPEGSLARVVDVSSFIALFQWQSSAGREPPLNSFPLMADEGMLHDWLQEQIKGDLERFIKAFLDAWNVFQREYPRRPAWTTTWKALAPHLQEGPNRWFQVWGVPKWAFPRWLIVLRYEASQVNSLVRPTVLDFGWYPSYFPPPPQAPLDDGGYAVDLRTSPPPTTLLPTFLHEPMDYTIEHWVAAGRLCGWTDVRPDLAAARQAHHELLVETYGQKVSAWMPLCL